MALKSSRGLVLTGFAEALAAPEAIWSLRDAGFDVVAFTRRGRRPAVRHARHVEIVDISAPEIDAEAAAVELAELAEDLKPLALLPLDDAAVWLARKTRCTRVAGPRGASTELALDKSLQLAVATSSGFRVPPTTMIASRADGALIQQFPIVLKPAHAVLEREGHLSRGRTWICADPEELEQALSAWGESEPLVAQPFIRGTGEGVFGIACRDGLRMLSAHRRLRMMNPHGSGSSACVPVPVEPELAAAATRFVEQAGWQGIFMLELLRDDEGQVWFVELNGRTWGSTALARRLGYEYPAWAVELALDPEFAPSSDGIAPRRDIVCRHLGRELVHLLFVLRGPRSRALVNWPSKARTLAEVLRVRRRDRWYNLRRGEGRVFLADTAQTLLEQVRKRL